MGWTGPFLAFALDASAPRPGALRYPIAPELRPPYCPVPGIKKEILGGLLSPPPASRALPAALAGAGPSRRSDPRQGSGPRVQASSGLNGRGSGASPSSMRTIESRWHPFPGDLACAQMIYEVPHWDLRYRNRYGGRLSSLLPDRRRSVDLQVVYQSPDLVELPDEGGWLLLSSRQRWLPGAGEAADMERGPENTLSDLVGWWSAEAEMSGPTLQGPFLMVDSLAVQSGAHPRAWLASKEEAGGLRLPEAQRLPDGSWTVSAQGRDSASPLIFRGEEADACPRWQEAWRPAAD